MYSPMMIPNLEKPYESQTHKWIDHYYKILFKACFNVENLL